MQIEVSELRAVVNVLLDYIERKNEKHDVNIAPEAYWFIAKESVYDPYDNSPMLTMGELSEDWDNLRDVLEKRRTPVGYDLVWLSTILRAIGDSTP